MDADLIAEAASQLNASAPETAVEALAGQLWLMRDAERRVQEEGAIVVDAKGNASEHPAIRVQRDAAKEVRGWLGKYPNRGPR